MSRYTITAALPYANGPLHIGHIAGAYLPADIFVRYLRMKGEDVIFVCGTDEHGVPITIKAKKEGITPQQVVDKYHEQIRDAFKTFGIDFDIFSRTTNKVHHKTAQEFFRNLYDKGIFSEEVTEQFYDAKENQFLADRYITGTCPKCGNENAYGDQCEKCGSTLNATDLINPRSTLSGEKPELKKTKNWFLPLGEFNDRVKEYIEKANIEFGWKTNVYGQCMSWLNQGLQSRAMTRDLNWGIPVPVDGADGKVLYVWFDAPIGYISATKELRPDDWEKYWKKQPDPKDDARLIEFIGKDNIVFHCIIFPAMLMAHGEFILPENVPANEFLNLEGHKLSTSRNWAVWLHEYLEAFPGREDELRYVLTSIAPETKDSDFSWKDYQARVNNELADILGNYVKRVIDLVHRYCDGKVPSSHPGLIYTFKEAEANAVFKSGVEESSRKMIECIERYRFREGLTHLMDIARAGNKFLADTEPWKLIKTDQPRVEKILFESLQNCLDLAFFMQPYLPHTSRKILKQLNLKEENILFEENGNGNSYTNLKSVLVEGYKIGESEVMFKKVEDSQIDDQFLFLAARQHINSVNESKLEQQSKISPSKPEIVYDDFSKMDIRIGTILEAVKVPKADKLLKLLIDTGIDKRIVVSGIAEYYKAENIIGQKVSILVNLAPRKIKGIESQGMILMAEDLSGKLVFVTPSEDVGNGSTIS